MRDSRSGDYDLMLKLTTLAFLDRSGERRDTCSGILPHQSQDLAECDNKVPDRTAAKVGNGPEMMRYIV